MPKKKSTVTGVDTTDDTVDTGTEGSKLPRRSNVSRSMLKDAPAGMRVQFKPSVGLTAPPPVPMGGPEPKGEGVVFFDLSLSNFFIPFEGPFLRMVTYR